MNKNIENRRKDLITSPYIVYAYIDTKTDTIAYVGSDKHGFKMRRHIEHFAPSHKNKQKCNAVLQAHPERYRYQVIAVAPDIEWMTDIEASMIAAFKAAGQCYLNIQEELIVPIEGEE